MIDAYRKIFVGFNHAMRDDPLLQSELPPEVFDLVIEVLVIY